MSAAPKADGEARSATTLPGASPSAPLRVKIFAAEADPNWIEREFNAWARSVEVVSIQSAMASCGPSDDQWIAMALTVLYRDRDGAK